MSEDGQGSRGTKRPPTRPWAMDSGDDEETVKGGYRCDKEEGAAGDRSTRSWTRRRTRSRRRLHQLSDGEDKEEEDKVVNAKESTMDYEEEPTWTTRARTTRSRRSSCPPGEPAGCRLKVPCRWKLRRSSARSDYTFDADKGDLVPDFTFSFDVTTETAGPW